ncbi:cell well associated RhsD protein [Dyadobacter luteus]|uniref:Cell well associated RhsD protein n=1 Tax=Dyadobacter luteus TaxID=2259619 RepID=A0A3D8Y7E6_9BACT|nr:cell well associated RhsD protein [Dyadobacter luteus]
MYMAEIGGWVTVDSLAEKFQSWSLYNYTMSSPIIMTDPTGMAPIHIDVSRNEDGAIQ